MHNYALTNNSIELPNLNNSHTNKVCSLAVKKLQSSETYKLTLIMQQKTTLSSQTGMRTKVNLDQSRPQEKHIN
jgi:hypothetical protein